MPWHSSEAQLSRALETLQVRTAAWSTSSEDCFIQSLPLLGLAPTNILNSTWKKGVALRKVKQREGKARWRKYIHIFQTSGFLNLIKTVGKIKFTGEQRELRPKMQSSSSNPQTSGLSHDSYTIQHPLHTTVKCRSTECFNEPELVTSNCFSHFASGCSSDPLAPPLQKHTHTREGQVISEIGKINERFPSDQNKCPFLSLCMKSKVCPMPQDKHRVMGFKTSSTDTTPNIFQRGRGSCAANQRLLTTGFIFLS